MFSGIVEAMGIVREMNQKNDMIVFLIQPQLTFNDLNIGDSISINGTCLTITTFTKDFFEVTAVPETLRLTNLGDLQVGSPVNLERALLVGARNGGHPVQGHVDCTGELIEFKPDGGAYLGKITLPLHLSKYVVNKGFIALDGMSITVIEAAKEWFTITLIPHTIEVTIAKNYQIGSRINIEVDLMAKHVEKLLLAYQ